MIAFDPFAKADIFKAAGVEQTGFDTLLEAADYVSVHAPLTPNTRGMMNAQVFAKMKKGAYLVNTARGPLIDEAALVAALDSGTSAAPGSTSSPASRWPRFAAARPRQRDHLAAHRVLFDRGASTNCRAKCATDLARVLSGEKAIYPISA